MATSNSELINIIPTLTPEQRDAVAAFIKHLKEGTSQSSPTSTQSAMEEFMREHSQLLQLLAQ